MSNLLFRLDELRTVAQMQMNTLKAVESAFRTGHDAIDKDAFAFPVNGLEDTLQTLSATIDTMFTAARSQEVA